jgi:hypothetical protein
MGAEHHLSNPVLNNDPIRIFKLHRFHIVAKDALLFKYIGTRINKHWIITDIP